MRKPQSVVSPVSHWSLVVGFLLALAQLAAAAPNEFFATGDFDGDGRSDLVIVDQATGSYRLSYQLSSDNYTWVKARASGIENVSSISAGKLFNTTRDALAITGPEANRINVLDASSTSTAGLPVTFHPSGIGPNLVLAIDVGGLGNTLHDDLFIATTLNSGVPNIMALVRNNAGAMSELSTAAQPAPLERGDRVVLKTGQPPLAGIVRRDPLNVFVAYRLTSGAAVIEASLAGLPAGSAYIWGRFNVSALSQFLFYVPGDTNLLLRPVQEPVPGTFSFGPGPSFTFSNALAEVSTVPGPTPRLFIIFADRTRAAVYDFDGINAPTLRQQFNATAGETFTGAGLLGGGNLMMYSSRDGSGLSTFFQTYNFNGSAFVAGASGGLPSVNALSARGNVMLFQNEPFITPTVNLLASVNASDWSSQLGALPGPVSVQAETFAGATQGLGSPALMSLGSSPPSAAHGLVNQYSNFISLFSLSSAQGDEVSDVRISPSPGVYKKGIVVSFTAANPLHQIIYRVSAGNPWTIYSGNPVRLFKNTTVQFYGKPPGNPKSRIKSAVYMFTDPPSSLDSDGDGVPDYVEIAKGLDPIGSGNDADGDGYFDLDELLAGTNPNDTNDPPAATLIPTVERQAVFDLAVSPRPWDGTVPGATLSVTGAAVRAYSLAASLLSYGKTTNTGLAGITDPAAYLSEIAFEKEERLLAVATEEHFSVATSSADKLLGRELIGLLPVPALRPPLAVAYTYGGGALNTEANNWLAAATASNALTHRAVFTMDLTIYDSLVALLTERKLSELLLSRGVSNANDLTLFGFRPTEVSRFNPGLGTLLALESRSISNQPAYLLQQVHGTLLGLAVTSSLPAIADLRALTADIYRISSASNNTAPGVYPLPVDALRQFIVSGTLNSNYLPRTTLSPGQLVNASTGVATLLAAIPVRPITNIELRVRSDSFGGQCTVLETTGITPTAKYLFHPGGQPYRLLEAFNLVQGARVQVLGYTDMTSLSCSGDGIEVITLQLAFVPAPSPTDSNGNLLADEWEALFGISNPFGDDDGDGYSNLQEMFDGTDPRDGMSRPAVPIADLTPPAITVETTGGGSLLSLSWDWPEPYASKVKFVILASPDLDTAFSALGLTPTKTGGHFELTLPNPGAGSRFFLLTLLL